MASTDHILGLLRLTPKSKFEIWQDEVRGYTDQQLGEAIASSTHNWSDQQFSFLIELARERNMKLPWAAGPD